jgi:cytochrome c oxidase subunit 1
MMGGTVMALIGGIHYWWPKIWGRMYNEAWARVAWALVFIGFNMTFFTQFIMGSRGMPRRYYTYQEQFHQLHSFSTIGTWVLAVGFIIMAVYLFYAVAKGKVAGNNPWGALTLEWQTTSPPPHHNFERQPIAVHGPYDYDTVMAEITVDEAPEKTEKQTTNK